MQVLCGPFRVQLPALKPTRCLLLLRPWKERPGQECSRLKGKLVALHQHQAHNGPVKQPLNALLTTAVLSISESSVSRTLLIVLRNISPQWELNRRLKTNKQTSKNTRQDIITQKTSNLFLFEMMQ